MQPNCSLYELTKTGDHGLTCTLAANYDEASYRVVPDVISFTRTEHTCRLAGKHTLFYFVIY